MSPAEQWIIFFEYLTDRAKREKINQIINRQEGIAMASQVLLNISKDDIERARRMSEEKYELDLQSEITYAKQQGMQQGIQEGIEQGMQIGEKQSDEKWQKIITNKDAEIAEKDALIAKLLEK